MKIGTLVAVVVLSGYVGLEVYTIRAASERMEPAYIHNMLVEAKVATERCQSSALELAPRFARTLQRATGSYEKDLLDKQKESNPTAADIDQQRAQQVTSAQKRATDEVDAKGCDHPDIKAHFQRYRIYAKKTR